MPQRDVLDADLPACQRPHRCQHPRVKEKRVEIVARDERLAQLGLPDTVAIPEARQGPPAPVEGVCVVCQLLRRQDLAQVHVPGPGEAGDELLLLLLLLALCACAAV
eukprot:SAG22_NODE_49_length_24620_cov_80.053587_22_plen_107_part_00